MGNEGRDCPQKAISRTELACGPTGKSTVETESDILFQADLHNPRMGVRSMRYADYGSNEELPPICARSAQI